MNFPIGFSHCSKLIIFKDIEKLNTVIKKLISKMGNSETFNISNICFEWGNGFNGTFYEEVSPKLYLK